MSSVCWTLCLHSADSGRRMKHHCHCHPPRPWIHHLIPLFSEKLERQAREELESCKLPLTKKKMQIRHFPVSVLLFLNLTVIVEIMDNMIKVLRKPFAYLVLMTLRQNRSCSGSLRCVCWPGLRAGGGCCSFSASSPLPPLHSPHLMLQGV